MAASREQRGPFWSRFRRRQPHVSANLELYRIRGSANLAVDRAVLRLGDKNGLNPTEAQIGEVLNAKLIAEQAERDFLKQRISSVSTDKEILELAGTIERVGALEEAMSLATHSGIHTAISTLRRLGMKYETSELAPDIFPPEADSARNAAALKAAIQTLEQKYSAVGLR